MKLPKFFRLCNQVLGIQGKQYISPKLTIPTSIYIHPSTHNQEKTSETIYLNLRKASVIQVMAILPNSRPSTGWHRGYLTNNCIKEIFDVGEIQVFQNLNDKIVTTTPRSSTPRDTATTPKCQKAPRTMFLLQNHRNDSKIPA